MVPPLETCVVGGVNTAYTVSASGAGHPEVAESRFAVIQLWRSVSVHDAGAGVVMTTCSAVSFTAGPTPYSLSRLQYFDGPSFWPKSRNAAALGSSAQKIVTSFVEETTGPPRVEDLTDVRRECRIGPPGRFPAVARRQRASRFIRRDLRASVARA